MRVLRVPIGAMACYAGLCMLLWALPLVDRLHVESAAIIAGAGFFIAGLSALRAFERGGRLVGEMLRQQAALLTAWLMLSATLLWSPNCGYVTGLMFFGLFPVISVALAVATAYTLAALPGRHASRWLIVGGLAVAVGGPIYDLAFHPQFYTYNHIFGGILGPIYDEELAIRPGLFWFRALTILWALLLVRVGRDLRRRGQREDEKTAGRSVAHVWGTALGSPSSLLVVFLIAGAYAFGARLGFNTPAWYLQERLGAAYRTPHFTLYYDPASLDSAEVQRIGEDHEYHYWRLAQRLGAAPEERIASYLYPDAETKASLTGARQTSVSPVWLPTPQVHVLLESYEDAFPHELAHVFSRQFGLPGVHASVAVGLVEGFAVAMEPPDGRPSPDEQVLAALSTSNQLEKHRMAEAVASRLSPLGFWTSRGAVSYTTMGSFVDYLLGAYPVAWFTSAYATANFEEVYGRSLEDLTHEWMQALKAHGPLSPEAAPLMARRFGQPSLFEQLCPHHVPRYVRKHRRAQQALARGDTARASQELLASLALAPEAAGPLATWASLTLSLQQPHRVAARLRGLPGPVTHPVLRVRLADALALMGRDEAARRQYDEALRRLPRYMHDLRMQLALRRQLAASPSVIGVLTSGEAAEQRAERLATLPVLPPAGQVLQALLLDAAGQPGGALRRYESAIDAAIAAAAVPRLRRALKRVAPVWHGRIAYHAGRLEAAAASARRAVEGYRTAGDRNAASHYGVLADKMVWLQARAERTDREVAG